MASFTEGSKITYKVQIEGNSTQWYENLRTYFPVASSVFEASHTSTVITNNSFFAYLDTQGSGSTIGLLPYTSTGKNHIPISSPAYQQPIIRAHSQLVSDFQFHPSIDTILYSCSGDRALKVWKFPSDGLVVDMVAPVSNLSNKSRSILKKLAPNSIANHILAVAGQGISIFDMDALKEVSVSSSEFNTDVLSIAWSARQDVLMLACRDKTIRFTDPRVNPNTFTLTNQAAGHTGLRYSSLIDLTDDYFLSFGHSDKHDREINLWDKRILASGPLTKHVLDNHGESVLLPQYDRDNQVLLLSSKGDHNLRVFQVNPSAATSSDVSSSAVFAEKGNDDILTPTLNGRDVVKGIALLPKQQNNYYNKEIVRCFKLSEGLIQPISVRNISIAEDGEKGDSDEVPSEMKTVYGSTPPLSAAAWLAGGNAEPSSQIFVPKKFEIPGTTDHTESNTLTGAAEDASSSHASLTSKKLSMKISQNTLKYKNMYGKDTKKELTFFNLSPDLSALDSPVINANETYWAIPYRGGGGPVYISTYSKYGKVEPECFTINGHKSSVQDIAFSPFHKEVMLTASYDCTIKVWNVEDAFHNYQEAYTKHNESLRIKVPSFAYSYNNAIGSFTSHTNSVRSLNFHPTVDHLFCSTAQDTLLKFFDLTQMTEVSSLKLHGSGASNSASSSTNDINSGIASSVSFNYDGSMLVVAGKDRMLRLIDPRRNSIIETISNSKYLGRNLRALWCARSCNEDPIATVSSNSNGQRQLNLWDARKWDVPAVSRSIDNASGQLYPMFDEPGNCIYLAGKGDTSIRVFEITSMAMETSEATNASASTEDITAGLGAVSVDDIQEEGEKGPATATASVAPARPQYQYLVEKCCDYASSRDPIAGICMLPKKVCDIRSIEVSRLLKLTTDSVIPISFHVPRADYLKDYFHDDIYLSIRSTTLTKGVSIDDWKNLDTPIELFQPLLESMKPEGMMNVSEKPVAPLPSESNSKIASYRNSIEMKKQEEKANEDKFNRLQQLALQNAQYHRNASGPVKIGGVVVSNPQLKDQAKDEDSDSDTDWS